MRYLIVANWKMNPETFSEAKMLFNSLKKKIKNIKNTELVICPSFVFLPLLKANGAQDCFWEEKGAYTGEVSPTMLRNIGCQYVIIGHSERRRYQEETDEVVNKKIKAALMAGLKPILCIANLSQLEKGLKGIYKKVVVAYEPVFAIGTGRPCSVEKAKKIRKLIKFPCVLYGGSVNSQNAADYIVKGGFQGLLIGGVSLDTKQFLKTINSIEKI